MTWNTTRYNARHATLFTQPTATMLVASIDDEVDDDNSIQLFRWQKLAICSLGAVVVLLSVLVTVHRSSSSASFLLSLCCRPIPFCKRSFIWKDYALLTCLPSSSSTSFIVVWTLLFSSVDSVCWLRSSARQSKAKQGKAWHLHNKSPLQSIVDGK